MCCSECGDSDAIRSTCTVGRVYAGVLAAAGASVVVLPMGSTGLRGVHGIVLASVNRPERGVLVDLFHSLSTL